MDKRIKKKPLFVFFFISFSILILSFVGSVDKEIGEVPTITRTQQTDTSCLNGKCVTSAYLGFINYNNGSEFVPINKTIVNSLDLLYDYEVVEGIYQTYFKENPTEGQVIKFMIGSDYITYQPMALNYRNDLSQLQQINMIQEVVGIPNDNEFLYKNAYGGGIDLKYSYLNDNLREQLIINSSTDLISPEQYIINGGNPTLDLDFILTTNSNKILIDGVEWDKKVAMTTSNEVYITDEEGNELYYLKKPYAYDSNGSSQLLEYQFKKSGVSLYVIVKTPYSWLSNLSTIYPIYIDPDTGLKSPGETPPSITPAGGGSVSSSEDETIDAPKETLEKRELSVKIIWTIIIILILIFVVLLIGLDLLKKKKEIKLGRHILLTIIGIIIISLGLWIILRIIGDLPIIPF